MRGKDSSSGDMLRHTNDIQTWLSSDGEAVCLLVAKQETNAKQYSTDLQHEFTHISLM